MLRISISAPLCREDVPGLCRQVMRLLSTTKARTICCEVGNLRADVVTLDALARMKLAAGRHGAALELVGASAELLELLAFTGLDRVLLPQPASIDQRRADPPPKGT
jgi:ABC-type transporter Mla MlaB component